MAPLFPQISKHMQVQIAPLSNISTTSITDILFCLLHWDSFSILGIHSHPPFCSYSTSTLIFFKKSKYYLDTFLFTPLRFLSYHNQYTIQYSSGCWQLLYTHYPLTLLAAPSIPCTCKQSTQNFLFTLAAFSGIFVSYLCSLLLHFIHIFFRPSNISHPYTLSSPSCFNTSLPKIFYMYLFISSMPH